MTAEGASVHRLAHPAGTTRIAVGREAFDALLAGGEGALAAELRGRTVFAVTSAPVRRLHGGVLDRLRPLAGRFEVLEVPDGEAAKSTEVAERLWRRMASAGGKRDSRLIAFGGGTVGDLAGFVAGCFARGVDYLQLPTTLLAQADAAIGGKTAINLPEAKNAVGLFHHPLVVVCDTAWLATLPRPAIRSGLAEALKMGVLSDPELFERIEAGLDDLLDGDPQVLAPVVDRAVRAKVEVVAADPGDRGGRAILNLGHTLGHAIEAASGYGPIQHGDAVAYGTLFALRLAAARGVAPETVARVRRLLQRFELPPLGELAPQRLVELMARDKKARETGLVWIVPRGLGRGAEQVAIDPAQVARELPAFLAAPLA